MIAITPARSIERDVDGIEHAAGQKHLDEFVEHADQRRRRNGEQGGSGDAAPLARALRERFIDEDGYNAVLEKVATLRDSHPSEHHEVDGCNAQRDADLEAPGPDLQPLRQDGHPNQEESIKKVAPNRPLRRVY